MGLLVELLLELPDSPTRSRSAAGSTSTRSRSQPLRVQMLSTSIVGGGAEAQVQLIARELVNRDYGVSIVSVCDPGVPESEFLPQGASFFNLGLQRGSWDVRALWKYYRVLRAVQPDVVHSHMIHANLLARASRLFARIPVQISTAHNYSEESRWRNLAYRVTDPLCDLTTTVCARCVDSFVAAGAVPKRRVKYVPNGLPVGSLDVPPDTRERLRRELGVGAGAFLWLAVGRLEEVKDYSNMIKAVAELSNRGSKSDFHVVLAGDGTLRDYLTAQLKEYRMEKSFKLLGLRSDVPSLMAAADGFLLSSRSEGLPMVLLEAAAARLPAVATDVGGNSDIIHNGETGFIVRPKDPMALARAMEDLISMGPEARAAMGERARQLVERNFGVGSVVDTWEQIYEGLITRRRK